jgi:hypothetical protein
MRRALVGLGFVVALAPAWSCGRAQDENAAPPPAPVVEPPLAPVTLVGHERLAHSCRTSTAGRATRP